MTTLNPHTYKLLFASILLAGNLCGQITLAGWADSIAFNELSLITNYDGIKALPSSANLKKWSPFPGNQVGGSCAGYAFGYNALTIQYAEHYNIVDRQRITECAFSPTYIYNQAKVSASDCDKGAELTQVARLLTTRGTCLMKSFHENNCSTLPEEPHHIIAQDFKIKEVLRLEYGNDQASKIDAVKRCIKKKLPVVFNFQVYSSFVDLENGDTFWSGIQRGDNYLGWHVMTIIGYDDELQVFELMSSWGTRWANQGYVYVSYDDLCKHSKFLSVLVPNFKINPFEYSNTTKSQKPSSSLIEKTSVQICPKKVVWQGNDYHLKTIPFSKENDHLYRSLEPIEKNDEIQIYIENIPKEYYLYVFSINGMKISTHWPRNRFHSTYNAQINQMVIVPTPESVLVNNNGKEETTITLLCSQPLHELERFTHSLEYIITQPGTLDLSHELQKLSDNDDSLEIKDFWIHNY